MSRHLETVKSGGCMPQDTCRACAQKRRVQKYAPVPPLYVFLLCGNEFPDQIILNIPRANTLTFQNSFYCGVPRIFNCLPPHLRKVNMSISQFKSNLLSHYRSLTELVYDVDVPQTFKTVCVKCHSCRTLSSLLVKMCCQ